MKPIDIDQLSEPELIDLNRRIVERLRFMNQMRAHSKMLEFSVGDRVTFQPDGDRTIVGVLVRYNKKSVTVLSDDRQRWNVSPGFLRRVEAESEAKSGNVVFLPRSPGRK